MKQNNLVYFSMNEDAEFIDVLLKLKIRSIKRIIKEQNPKIKLNMMRELGINFIQVSKEYKL